MATKKTYGAEEARANLPALLERAHHGSPTVITKRGRPYAALVPVPVSKEKRSTFLTLAGTGKGLWGRRPSERITAMREEWE